MMANWLIEVSKSMLNTEKDIAKHTQFWLDSTWLCSWVFPFILSYTVNSLTATMNGSEFFVSINLYRKRFEEEHSCNFFPLGILSELYVAIMESRLFCLYIWSIKATLHHHLFSSSNTCLNRTDAPKKVEEIH